MTDGSTSVVVTALYNQPEAFASDLGEDQSRYLFVNVHSTSLLDGIFATCMLLR